MQYDLSSDLQRKSFQARIDVLLEKAAVVELTEKSLRTKGQNNYLHLLIGVVAMETGNTLADVKEYYFKEICNSDKLLRHTSLHRIPGHKKGRPKAAFFK